VVTVAGVPWNLGIEALGGIGQFGIEVIRNVADIAIQRAGIGRDHVAVHGIHEPLEFIFLGQIAEIAGHEHEIHGAVEGLAGLVKGIDPLERGVEGVNPQGLLGPPRGRDEGLGADGTGGTLFVYDLGIGDVNETKQVGVCGVGSGHQFGVGRSRTSSEEHSTGEIDGRMEGAAEAATFHIP
jgi:hypothetical protein